MTNEEAFEKWAIDYGLDYEPSFTRYDVEAAWNAAIAYMQEHNKSAEQSEPVAEIILDPSFLPALRVPLIDWKTPIVDFEVGTKLYDKPQPLKRLDEDRIDEIFSTYTDEQGYVAIDDWHLLTNAIMDEIERINRG